MLFIFPVGQKLRSSETQKINACKRLLNITALPFPPIRLSAEESVANVEKNMFGDSNVIKKLFRCRFFCPFFIVYRAKYACASHV